MARSAQWQGENRVVKCDVRSYVKNLYIENSNDYYYQVIHNSFPHYPHFPHIQILNKKFTNTKHHISINSIIVIIPNFTNMTISHSKLTISHKNMTISQPSIPAHFAVNIPFCLNPNLLNLSNIL